MKLRQKCGGHYPDIADWQKLCKPCYAKSKRAEEALAQKQEFENERLVLLHSIRTLYRRIYDLENKLAELKKPNVFDPDLIKKIRVLAHPDKHNGSELSLNVSKILNSLISQRSSVT